MELKANLLGDSGHQLRTISNAIDASGEWELTRRVGRGKNYCVDLGHSSLSLRLLKSAICKAVIQARVHTRHEKRRMANKPDDSRTYDGHQEEERLLSLIANKVFLESPFFYVQMYTFSTLSIPSVIICDSVFLCGSRGGGDKWCVRACVFVCEGVRASRVRKGQ